jgi:hypothetical protein
MEIIDQLLSQQDVFYKIVLLVFMLLYSLFALILYIQISAMIKVVNQISFSPVLRFIAFANILASIAIIGYTILTLSI